MQVQFKNALFDSALFAFAVVNGSTLTIVLENAEIDLDFDTEAEALEAQAELGEYSGTGSGWRSWCFYHSSSGTFYRFRSE